MPAKILIADDDAAVTTSLSLLLKQAGYKSDSASSPAEAYGLLDKNQYGLFLQDMNFSRRTTGGEGLKMLKEVKSKYPNMPVILITAWGSISLAVEGIRSGASDFITKPWTNEQILQSVKTALGLAKVNSVSGSSKPLTRPEMDEKYDFRGLIGEDRKILHILDIIGRISPTEASVLITGESGTGKELVAEAIHNNSLKKDKPFVKVNLGGISTTLFESEMFGHVKGAFTDAKHSRKGRFELADGGTIFLDEFGDLDLDCQVKLLRVLQDRTYEPLGSSKTRSVDVRVISATNRNLPELIERGELREDLLYRMNLISIHMPALRDRAGDIPLLTDYFLAYLGKAYRRHNLSITDSCIHWLKSLIWPGNIRELKQLLERTVLLSNRDILDIDDFNRAAEMQHGEPDKNKLPGVGSMTLDEIERAMIVKSLAFHNGNVSKVAEALGVSRAALYRRIERYGIES